MIRRKGSTSDGASKGFSFDLVSRRKQNKDGETKKVRSPLELLTDKSEPAEVAKDVVEAPVETPQPDIAPVEETPTFGEQAESTPAEAPKEEPLFLAERSKVVAPPADPEPAAPVQAAPEQAAPVQTPAPQDPAAPQEASDAGRSRRQPRVKTTFLGFERSDGRIEDIFAGGQSDTGSGAIGEVKFPVGWLVVVKGPGRGTSVSLQAGVSQIGRGDDQAVQLDFGDNGISRENHAAIAFDDEEGKFFLGHGGKANIVRLNGKPVLSTEELSNGDEVRISETTLRFIALCDEDFTWAEDE